MVLRFLAIGVYCLALLSGLMAFGAAPRDACYRLFLMMAAACALAAWAFPVQALFRKRFLPLFALGVFIVVQIPFRPPVERYGYVFLALGWLALTFTLLLGSGNSNRGRFLFLFLVALGLLDAFYGLVQSLGGVDYIGDYERGLGNMASGTFVNRNHFAGLLNMTIPVALGALYATFPRRGHQLRSEGYAWAWIILLVTGFMGLAILLSWSRGGTLSLIASLIFLSILMMLKRRRRENRRLLSGKAAWVLIVTTIALGAWVGLDTLLQRFGQAEGDATERLAVYRDSLRMVKASPLVGVGPKMYQYYFKPPVDASQDCRWTHAHNDYLETAVEYGVPIAVLFWGFILWRLWRAGWLFLEPPKNTRSDSDLWTEGIALGCAGAVFSILLHSLVDFNLQIPINWVVFWMVVGLAWSGSQLHTSFVGNWDLSRVAAASVLSLLVLISGWAIVKESIAMQIADAETIPAYQEALRWVPDHPVFHFGLGLLYRDDVDQQDLQKAGQHLEAAVRFSPREWVYWQELGRYYEFSGAPERAEKAMLTCLEIMPLYSSEQWRLGNFYLQQGRVGEGLVHIKQAIELKPGYREAALMVLWKAGLTEKDVDRVWPSDKESRLMRLRFLIRSEAPVEEIDRQWRQAVQSAGSDKLTRDEAAFYFEHLSRRKAFNRLRQEWIEVNRSAGVEDSDFEQGANLIWNGRFRLSIGTGLLDWQIPSSEAYDAQVENGFLTIEFKGTANLSLGMGQLVIVPAPGRYELSVTMGSEEISTEQGPYVQVSDSTTGKVLGQTEQMLGSRSLSEQKVAFEVPEGTGTVWVGLRRNLSKRIDNKIRGTLTIREVVIAPAD